jgi:hypothetical protein
MSTSAITSWITVQTMRFFSRASTAEYRSRVSLHHTSPLVWHRRGQCHLIPPLIWPNSEQTQAFPVDPPCSSSVSDRWPRAAGIAWVSRIRRSKTRTVVGMLFEPCLKTTLLAYSQLHLDEIATKITLGARAILLLDQAGWHGFRKGLSENQASSRAVTSSSNTAGLKVTSINCQRLATDLDARQVHELRRPGQVRRGRQSQSTRWLASVSDLGSRGRDRSDDRLLVGLRPRKLVQSRVSLPAFRTESCCPTARVALKSRRLILQGFWTHFLYKRRAPSHDLPPVRPPTPTRSEECPPRR